MTGRRQSETLEPDMLREVQVMTASSAEFSRPRTQARAALDAYARRRGVRPVESIHDLAQPEVFESYEELDAFLAHVRAERDANLA